MAREKLDAIVELIPVLPLPKEAEERYSDIRAALAAAGTPISANDLWIAAHVRAARLTVVTNNLREFERVDGLKLENWARGYLRHPQCGAEPDPGGWGPTPVRLSSWHR